MEVLSHESLDRAKEQYKKMVADQVKKERELQLKDVHLFFLNDRLKESMLQSAKEGWGALRFEIPKRTPLTWAIYHLVVDAGFQSGYNWRIAVDVLPEIIAAYRAAGYNIYNYRDQFSPAYWKAAQFTIDLD